jgi:hypothetical protein
MLWTVLSLPAIAEVDDQIPIGQVHCRRAGEALHPEHESLAALERLRREVGSDVFAAQYQQAPVPPGGAMIKRQWLRYYAKDDLPERTYRTKVIQSWDTAAKDGAQNDWSVCTTWLVVNKEQYYLLDLTRGRYEYPRLRETAVALAQRHKPDVTSGGTRRRIIARAGSGGDAHAVTDRRMSVAPRLKVLAL